MTTELLIKGFFALVFSGIFAWTVFDRDPSSNVDSSRQRYAPYISGILLPISMLTLLSMELIFTDGETAMQIMLAFCFGVFIAIGNPLMLSPDFPPL